ncbi:MEX3C family protein [Megaselia abdita]
MTNQENAQNILDNGYLKFKTALNLEIPSDLTIFPNSPPFYKPSCLLDMNWNDGDDDVFILNMFKKVFYGQSSQTQVFTESIPPTSTPTKSLCDSTTDNDFRFFDATAPSFNSNMVTECVSVPSSKHVAQILGKKGSKIRALRETTNTYIRSPLPKEEPIFIVKGKKDNVAEAVRAILSASDFFTSLELEKEISYSAAISSSRGEAIIVKFSIPESYVGLVVGVKGGTIKEIEKQTKTYIQSPTMDSDPIFTITGSPEDCEKAMNFVSRYLALRGVGPGTVECVNNLEVSPGSASSSNSGCDYFFTWVHVVDQPQTN